MEELQLVYQSAIAQLPLPASDPNGIRLLMHLLVGVPAALEPSLQQTQQSRVPVSEDEQQQERHRKEVLSRNRVVHRPREVATNCKFDPRHNSEALAIDLRLASLALLLH